MDATLLDADEVLADARRRSPYPADLDAHFLRPREVEHFRQLVNEDGSETALDHCLQGYPDLWSAFLHQNHTGYQGGKVLSQQMIQPAVPEVQPGLIPDYLISGKNSDGISWWVVELKGAKEKMFAGSGSRLRLSKTANQGILQLLRYLDFCAEHQAVLRDVFKLEGFREPQGILLIGRQEEFTSSEERQKMKRIWNQSNHLLEVRTYDAFLRSLDDKLSFYGFRPDGRPSS